MNLVLDTGSSNTAVISDSCLENCSFVQKPYLPMTATDLNSMNLVNASYGHGHLRSSWKGISSKQTISFNDDSIPARIDLITENQSFFIPRCEKNQGIWGLAHPSLQTNNQETLFDTIRKERNVPNSFTYQVCSKLDIDDAFQKDFEFLSQSISTRNVSLRKENHQCLRQGHFWVGGYPTKSVGSEIVWVSMGNERYYEVVVDGFLVDEKVVQMEKINLPRTIVDTGTKDIVLSAQVFVPFFFDVCCCVCAYYFNQLFIELAKFIKCIMAIKTSSI